MATILSHPVIPLTLGLLAVRPHLPWRLIFAGMICAIIPDIDVIGFQLQVDYHSPYGHRGFTHSLAFAAALAAFISLFFKFAQTERSVVWLFLFVATVSHGLLDAFTNGGLGVAFFWPFNETRYFFPAPPIQVSPIGIKQFFTQRGMAVLQSELIMIWIPCLLLLFVNHLFSLFKTKHHD